MKTILETDQNFICDIKAPCFQKLSLLEQTFIRSSKTQVQFRKGENLSKQGAFASYVLFIIDGLAKQYVEGDLTHSFNICLLQPGDFIGLSTVFNKNTFSYSTIALTPTLAYLIEKDTIASVLKQNAEFAFGIINKYCKQDVYLYDIISKLTYKQMNGRLADALLYLSSEIFNEESVFIHLSRKDIADFAGISTESTVKLLKSFERDNLIQLDEKNILILNREALVEVSKNG